MPKYNEEMAIRYVMLKILILEVAKVTSPHVLSQCLPINYNIFNGKNTVLHDNCSST